MDKTWAYVSTAAAIMVIILSITLPAYPQDFPLFRFGSASLPNQSIDFNSFIRGDWLRDVRLGRTGVGIFIGGGLLRVTHTIEAGPQHVAALPGFHDFDDFSHVRETPLRDAYVSLDAALAAQGFEFLQFKYETNIGRVTQFKQSTDPGVQHPFGWHSRYAVGSVIRLPNNDEGIIYLDNRNRIWSVDLTGRIPGFWGVDFLLEYKWSNVKSSLDPYSIDNPVLGSRILAPNVGWRNNWTNSIPSTTSFNMSQNFKWHGPFIGLSVRNPFLAWGAGGYLEFVGSPCLFGRYEFEWGAAYEDGFFFVRGWQATKVAGWDRIGLEVRGGIACPLFGRLALDVSGKYTFIRLRDSSTEYQAMSNNFLATQDYVQGAQEYVTATQQFWQVGGDINFPF